MLELEQRFSDSLRQAVSRSAPNTAEQAPVADAISDAWLRWEVPRDPSFGDLSNSVSFKVAARLKQPPQRIAEELSDLFLACCRQNGLGEWVGRVEAKTGFLNIFLSQQALARVLHDILQRKARYGTRQLQRPSSVNLEFVSANPTGPLSVAHGRQAGVGDRKSVV